MEHNFDYLFSPILTPFYPHKNPKGKGVLPVATLGTKEFDVTTIDPETILLTREGYEEGVSPIHLSYEDVATPYMGEE